MVRRRVRVARQAGFTLAELVATVAVLGVLATLAVPAFLSFWRSWTLRAAAEEMATVLNMARELAIKENTSVCVSNDGARVRYHVGGCAAAAWTGAGTDAGGFIGLSNRIGVSGPGNVVFTYLGAAAPAGTYTVRSPQDDRTLSVTVAATGRVTIGP